MITSKEYVGIGGIRCPSCGSNRVEGAGKPNFDDSVTIYWPAKCNACGATWDDTYELAGYENLKEGN